MKKKLLAMMLGIVAMFTSCQKEDSGQLNLIDGKATFSVAVNDGIATRTVPNLAPSRYIMEVYEVTNPNDAVSGTVQQRYEKDAGSFDVILKEGANYACLFWADYGKPKDTEGYANNEYNATDLKDVKVVSYAKAMAFGGSVRFTYDSKATDKPYLTQTLTHSVAQVNFKQTEDFTADNNTLKVEFPKTFSLNLDGNVAKEILTSEASTKATHTFTGIAKASANTSIGTSYIIAASATQTVMDIKTTFNSEVVKDISAVPFQRNYKTNISGAYSNLYATTLSVECDDAWETPDNNEVFPKLVAVGDYYYSDGTFSTKYDDTKTAIGIVFWVDPSDATKGKIVALDETTALWATSYIQVGNSDAYKDIRSDYNTGTVTDVARLSGKANRVILDLFIEKNTQYTIANFPAFPNVAKKAEGWYLPAVNELQHLYCSYVGAAPTEWQKSTPSELETDSDTATKFNNALKAVGEELASGRYWSATENPKTDIDDYAWCVDFSNGNTSINNKASGYGNLRVRLVRDIE